MRSTLKATERKDVTKQFELVPNTRTRKCEMKLKRDWELNQNSLDRQGSNRSHYKILSFKRKAQVSLFGEVQNVMA